MVDQLSSISNPTVQLSITTTELKRWFYAGVTPAGALFRGGCDVCADFLERVNTSSISWVDYVSQDFEKDSREAALALGFSPQLVDGLLNRTQATYLDFDTEMGIKIPTVQVTDLSVDTYPLMLLIKKNFVFTIHPLNVDRRFTRLRRYAETFLRKIPIDLLNEDKITLLLARIIDENNDRNFEHLREIEEQGDKLNESMTNPYTPRNVLGPEIYRMKHALITYLDALWDTVHVLHTLRYGDAELITNDAKLMDKLGALTEDVNRQIGLAEHMSEVLSSGLEVLQSIYNNQLQNLNNRLALLMTYLTIIGTAVLVPNTLATIMGNSVFEIGPKDLWWYLIMMIGSTVAATWFAYWFVRRRGWLPKKMD